MVDESNNVDDIEGTKARKKFFTVAILASSVVQKVDRTDCAEPLST